jgi:scyllo-inositol 2-dehydrogenase (NADP+)
MATRTDAIDVGVVGFGLAGRVFHMPLLHAAAGLRVTAILERSGDAASRAWPGTRVVRSLEELLAIDAIRLVVIGTPTPTHAELAIRCLEAGRDVVVDKPFAASVEEARGIIETAARTGRLLSVFQNRRWDGDFLTVQRLIREGAIGRPVLFESHFDRYRPVPKAGSWRERPDAGGGIFLDLGVHLIDQALTLFGSPDAVTADIRTERDGFVTDDAFDVVHHYPRLRALLRSTMLASEKVARFVVHGTTGTFVKFNLDPQEERLASGGPWRPEIGIDPPERWGRLTRPTGDSFTTEPVATEAGDYRRFYENIRDAIHGSAPLAVTPQQALDVMRILELARASSLQRRTLPFTPQA